MLLVVSVNFFILILNYAMQNENISPEEDYKVSSSVVLSESPFKKWMQGG